MSKKLPGGIPAVRAHNRGLVLGLLRDHGGIPRADLARRTGLSATTITKVVAELLGQGLVAESETDAAETRVGRPSIDVTLVPDARLVCGVQVHGGAAQIGLADLRATIVATREVRFDMSEQQDRVLDRIAETARDLIAQTTGGKPDTVLGLGVAAPGPVDPARRRNVLSINLGWRDVPFADHLEAALGLPVVVDHNVRAMALAESRYGAPSAQNLVYVYVRTGVGAGVVINGEPFHPGTYGVTELGHLQVVEKGRRCACGATGCLETVASEGYLTDQIRVAVDTDPAGTLALAAGRTGGPLPALEHAAGAGDTTAEGILRDLADHLSTALASAVNLLNPDLIVLGGVFAAAGEKTLDRIRTALHAKAFPVICDAVQVVATTLGVDAGVAGAAAVALDEFFYSPTTLRQLWGRRWPS